MSSPLSTSIPSPEIHERIGDISSSFLPSENQLSAISSTDVQVEEESFENELNSFNESIEPPMSENIYNFDTSETYDLDNETEESEINLVPQKELYIDPTPRRSNRRKQPNFRFSGKEWINTVCEIKEENIPWSQYGDHAQFLPEPKGLKNVMRLETRDPIAFKLWARAIRGELRNLITQGTFQIEDAKQDEVVIPTTYVFKIKLLLDGSWDKAKARCCVRGDILRKIWMLRHYNL